jgi:hypothetical protein
MGMMGFQDALGATGASEDTFNGSPIHESKRLVNRFNPG